MKFNESYFEEVVQKMTENRNVYGAILCVENGDGSISWSRLRVI